MVEIKDLRREIGELQWTNRELKISVQEKSSQIKTLIRKIELFEKMLILQKTKNKMKPQPVRESSLLEDL